MSLKTLVPGDRVPNLTFPDLTGKNRLMYLEVFGGPIVLAIAPDPNEAPGEALLAGLAKRSAALDKIGAHRFVISRREPAGRLDPGALVMIDPYGDGMKLFRPATDGSEDEAKRSKASIAVLDPNQRLVALFTAENHRDPAGEALKVAEQVRARSTATPVRLDRAAPVPILDNLMPPDLCDRLAALWEADDQGGPAREHVITDPDLQREVAQTIGPRVMNEVNKVFNYRQPLRFEILTVIGQDSSHADVPGPHRDNLRAEQRRRFAVTLPLNDGYEGGELVFPEYGPHHYALPKGAGAIFSCDLLHQTLPVLSGRALMLSTFLIEPGQPR